MKRIIKNKASGRFLTVSGGWTQSIGQAQNFPDFASAISAQQKLQRTDVELVLMMGDTPDPIYDVAISMGPPLISAPVPAQSRPIGEIPR